MTHRLVVLASGSGSNLQAILDATAAGTLDAEVVLVVTNRRSAYATQRAEAAGVPTVFAPRYPTDGRCFDTREAYDADLAVTVGAARPDLVVQAGWMHLFSRAFLGRFPGQVVNLHPALPGQFPGATAIDDAWQAYLDAKIVQTGVMVHLVPDEGVDNGPVLAQRQVPIRPSDTRQSLEDRIHSVEHELLVGAISEYLRSR